MMQYLRHIHIIERASKRTGIQNKTLSRIKAESRRWSSRLGSHGMKPSDFDKCEICIHCKTTQKQDNKLYIIKTIFYFGFRTTISSLLFKKIKPMCICALPTEPRSHLKYRCDINCFVIIIPLICIRPHVPLFSIV